MDIRELKMALKTKQEELSEMCIRKDLVEKKLSNINKDRDSESVKLRVIFNQSFIKRKEFKKGAGGSVKLTRSLLPLRESGRWSFSWGVASPESHVFSPTGQGRDLMMRYTFLWDFKKKKLKGLLKFID